jgi:ATP-dependent Clp protease ATP-binding subunit ClpC
MRNDRSESELASLTWQAGELAAARRERLTTVHLLAAIASRSSAAAELLLDRNLHCDALLKAGRSFDEDDASQFDRAVASARELAKRVRAPISTDGGSRKEATLSPDSRPVRVEAGASHLLVALLADRRLAAHRALVLSGTDVTRLRTLALASVHGIAAARRETASSEVRGDRATSSPSPRATASRRAEGARPSLLLTSLPTTSRLALDPTAPSRSRAASVNSVATPPSTRPAPSPRMGASTVVPLLPPSSGSRLARTKEAPSTSERPVSSRSPVSAEARRPRNTKRALAASKRLSGSDAIHLVSAPAINDAADPSQELDEASVAVGNVAPTRVGSGELVIDRAAAPTLAAVARVVPSTSEAIGREAELDRLLDVLAKHRANTPCLVGPPGVGKSTTALALAGRLAREGSALVEVRVGAVVSGTGVRGAIAERIGAVFEEARKLVTSTGVRVVVLFDDVHELLGAGDEASAQLKQELGRSEVPVVLATSLEGLRRSIECDAQLARRVTPVEIDEPDEAGAFFMLRAAMAELGRHHRATYSDEAIASAVSWSVRYLPTRALPDKALTALDEAGARARRAAGNTARSLEVAREDVARAISELADVPVERLLETDRDRLLRLEEHLARRVVGHARPLARISAMLRKSAAGLRGRRPLGSFLLLGPTGVGKTETAKAIAEALFGSGDAMTRIDMSELSEAHAVARLLGAPPGYVGHEAGGQLTEAVRKRPYQVVLLDEVEKAHQDVLLAFLQVLDEGHLTDSRGRRVDFTNVVVVATSNLGAKELASAQRSRAVGFARQSSTSGAELADTAIQAAKRALPIELYNRLDEVLFFAPLTRDEMAAVARQMIEALGAALEARDIVLRVEDDAIEALLDSGGFEPELGARPMRRAVARLVEAPLAELLLRRDLERGSVAIVTAENGEVVVDAISADRDAAATA